MPLLFPFRRRETTTPGRAKELLGAWMAEPADVERHLGPRYSERDLARLGDVPWSEATLRESAGSCALFPGYPLTLLELRGKGRSPWLCAPEPSKAAWLRAQRFAAREKVSLRWYLVERRTRARGGGTFVEDAAAVGRAHELPRAVEVAFMTALFEEKTGGLLFTDEAVRCSDRTGRGFHAGVGWGGVQGWSDEASTLATRGRLGVALSRKPYR